MKMLKGIRICVTGMGSKFDYFLLPCVVAVDVAMTYYNVEELDFVPLDREESCRCTSNMMSIKNGKTN